MDISRVKEIVLRHLTEHPERNFSSVELVGELAHGDIQPVDVKIATLNLVQDGKAHMNISWLVGVK